MPEPITQTVEKSAVQAEAPKEDLLTRVSKVELKPAEASNPDQITFNVKDLDKITDPTARKFAEDAYKSLQADYTKKTQALASKSKDMDTLKAQLDQSGQYTPDKISQLLNDPSFVRAAQEYQRINGGQSVTNQNGNSELTQEEFSYLTPEQQKLYTTTKKVEQTNNAILSRLHASEMANQDMGLKSKYANYNPVSVNEVYEGMMTGKIQATREHLWKVVDYESAVERAYKLGLEDRKVEMGEKLNASSTTNGMSVTASSDIPVREKNESGIEYFKRLAIHNAQKLMKK